jgi:hypothetical protein
LGKLAWEKTWQFMPLSSSCRCRQGYKADDVIWGFEVANDFDKLTKLGKTVRFERLAKNDWVHYIRTKKMDYNLSNIWALSIF